MVVAEGPYCLLPELGGLNLFAIAGAGVSFSTIDMTPVQSSPAPTQVQQFFNGITARLAQLAKDPPELLAYLRAHAECVSTALNPTGFSYEMRSGSAFQRMLQANVESLGYKDSPEQENAFQRAILAVADQRKPLLLPPHSNQSTGLQGLSVEDSPAPEELPIFNRTPFEQMFIPLPMGEVSAGVLHIWFQPGPPGAAQTRVTLLKQLCGEIDQYFKARRTRDVAHEVTRLTTYAKLLEELTGDIELESVGWNLVNFAREAVVCDRVCLFTASNYDRALPPDALMSQLEYEFVLQACSGLKKPHPKSEQAVVLKRVAQTLTQMSLEKRAAPPNPEPAGTAAVPNGSAPVEKKPENTTVATADANRPRMQITLMMRDPTKTATRPPEVNDYFHLMPMNWATVIPLFDRNQRVCGILLFEGTKVDDKLAAAMKPMLELAVSAGRALGTALYCNQHRSMRIARRVITWREQYINTPAKRKWMRYGIPIVTIALLLAFPFNYRIKGNASILATTQITLPSLVNSSLLEVLVREGEPVKKGQVLARFDTKDIRLQLAQVEQEYERSLVESDAALSAGNESQMQISRLNAAKAAAIAEKLRADEARAVIRAPFDGLVLGAQTLSTRIGDIPKIGEPVLQVIDPSAWQVKAALRERDVIFLGDRLREKGTVPATLRLSSDPAHSYQLTLNRPDQLAYGLDTSTGDYQFTAMVPLKEVLNEKTFLKSGFTGRISFDAGRRSLAYILFKDFIDFITVRFF
jgi:hypothetical protein